MTLLIGDPEVATVPVLECGEPLVRLDPELSSSGRGGVIFRSGIAARLERSASLLPGGVGLAVVDTFWSAPERPASIAVYTAAPRSDSQTLRGATFSQVVSSRAAPRNRVVTKFGSWFTIRAGCGRIIRMPAVPNVRDLTRDVLAASRVERAQRHQPWQKRDRLARVVDDRLLIACRAGAPLEQLSTALGVGVPAARERLSAAWRSVDYDLELTPPVTLSTPQCHRPAPPPWPVHARCLLPETHSDDHEWNAPATRSAPAVASVHGTSRGSTSQWV